CGALTVLVMPTPRDDHAEPSQRATQLASAPIENVPLATMSPFGSTANAYTAPLMDPRPTQAVPSHRATRALPSSGVAPPATMSPFAAMASAVTVPPIPVPIGD